MHRFFCIYNHMTEKYELSLLRGGLNFNSKARVQAENSLLPAIRNSLQQLYSDLILLKEKITDELALTKLDESECVGSFLTFAYESGLPVSFCTNGQGVPDDLKKASTLVLMEYLKGFDMGLRPVIGQLT